MLMRGPVYWLQCFASEVGTVLIGALVNPRPMTWYKAWREMFPGVWLVMNLVERRGVAYGLVVGISSRLSSGSTLGIE